MRYGLPKFSDFLDSSAHDQDPSVHDLYSSVRDPFPSTRDPFRSARELSEFDPSAYDYNFARLCLRATISACNVV